MYIYIITQNEENGSKSKKKYDGKISILEHTLLINLYNLVHYFNSFKWQHEFVWMSLEHFVGSVVMCELFYFVNTIITYGLIHRDLLDIYNFSKNYKGPIK